jgi:hypothetical protein
MLMCVCVCARGAQHHTRVRIATLRGKWPAYQLWMICCFPPSLSRQYKVSYKINPPLVARSKMQHGVREGDAAPHRTHNAKRALSISTMGEREKAGR